MHPSDVSPVEITLSNDLEEFIRVKIETEVEGAVASVVAREEGKRYRQFSRP